MNSEFKTPLRGRSCGIVRAPPDVCYPDSLAVLQSPGQIRGKSSMASIEEFPRGDMAKLEAEVTGVVSRVGVTAEAVTRELESAAKEIEAMGAELISAVKKWEAITTDVNNVIRDAAEAYRQQGKKMFERIEESALFTEDVRKSCEDVKRRLIEG
jgi:hypothetical protein